MRNILGLMVLSLQFACGGAGGYNGLLSDGMKNEGLEGVRLVARSQPQSRDLTCRVQEATTTKGGAFSFDKLCRDQSYVLSVPELNLHLSGGNTIIGGEQEAPGTHSAWRAPDGQGVFKLFGQKVLPVPTFSDVAEMKPSTAPPSCTQA